MMENSNDPTQAPLFHTRTRALIRIAPIVLVVLYACFIAIPSTRDLSLQMLKENHPIEQMTTLVFIVGGVVGLLLARKMWQRGEERNIYIFYALFSLGLLFIAMEEAAWGQWIFGFETPELWRMINRQGDMTIHNIAGLNGHSELLRLTFGIGGLVGIYVSKFPAMQKIQVPTLLLSWFLVIIVHALVDVYNDIFPIQDEFDYYITKTSELLELIIALSALLFLSINFQMYKMLKPRRES